MIDAITRLRNEMQVRDTHSSLRCCGRQGDSSNSADSGNSAADPLLSVIIPAYNEENRLPQTILRITEYFASLPYKFEVIIVDDGSVDRTAQIAEKASLFYPNFQVISLSKNSGKGHAVRNGILRANGQYILFSDADLSTPISEAEKLLFYLNNGAYDIAIGSRRLPQSELRVRQPWHRRLMGRTFNMIIRLFVVRGISDTQCGFKCFTRESAQRIFRIQKLNGFGFDVEILYLAHKYGFSVKEVPVVWRDSPETKVKCVRDSANMLLDLLRIWYNNAHGEYAAE